MHPGGDGKSSSDALCALHGWPREDEVARRWWALLPGTRLPLSAGGSLLLLFPGRPGGRVGPDVRDAVLLGEDGEQVGDVELHVRAGDWYLHGHHQDARYNTVILHVVLICDQAMPPRRQDGCAIPVCSLYDAVVPPEDVPLSAVAGGLVLERWPCRRIWPQLEEAERARLLELAGCLRFEEKAQAFVEILHKAEAHGPFCACDVALIPALAEGLAYGRDRAFFRAAGLRLLGLSDAVPVPLGRARQPAPLDAARLRILRTLVERWTITGAWSLFRQLLVAAHPRPAQLRAVLAPLGSARSDILICNVVLPFAGAVALIEGDEALAARAQQLYRCYPALPSNQVTRAMCAQLLLPAEPARACQQQGLHYIYRESCRAKHCAFCMAGKKPL
jgi:hypothetical protein